jgi:ATP-binding cassette subfamily B protein
VSFSYDKQTPLLRDITFQVQPGQRFALVGPTGCGKTTLINLLLRFYDTDAGSISLDGYDTRLLTRSSLRAAFGMVLQDTWLFEGTIRDNIAYGKPNATHAEVQEAARRAHADSFIQQLPQGYDTVLSERQAACLRVSSSCSALHALCSAIPPFSFWMRPQARSTHEPSAKYKMPLIA